MIEMQFTNLKPNISIKIEMNEFRMWEMMDLSFMVATGMSRKSEQR